MKEKFYHFMQGRYGNDQFNLFLMVVSLALLVLSMLWKPGFFAGAVALLAWGYYRMLSRKVYSRSLENQRYLDIREKALCRLRREKNLLVQRKSCHIYKCPGCGQKVRIPRGRGKVEIHCPKCGKDFIKRS